jgi:hypothetical protein
MLELDHTFYILKINGVFTVLSQADWCWQNKEKMPFSSAIHQSDGF